MIRVKCGGRGHRQHGCEWVLVDLLLPTLGLDQLLAGHAHAGIWCRNHHGAASNQNPTTCGEGTACPFLHALLVSVEGEMLAAYQLLDGPGLDALLNGRVAVGTWCPHFVARHHRGVGEASGHRDHHPCGGDTGRLRCEHIHHRTAVVPVDGIDVPLVHMRANRGLHFVLQRLNRTTLFRGHRQVPRVAVKECRVKHKTAKKRNNCERAHTKDSDDEEEQHRRYGNNSTHTSTNTPVEVSPTAGDNAAGPSQPPGNVQSPRKHVKAAGLCPAFLQDTCPHSDDSCEFTHDHILRSLVLANNQQPSAATSVSTPTTVLATIETANPRSTQEELEQPKQDDSTSTEPPGTDPRQPDLSLFVLDTNSMCKVAPMLVTEVGKYLQQHSGAVNIAFSSRSVEELESIPFKKGPNGPSVDGRKEVASFKKHFRPYVECDDQARDEATPTVQYQHRSALTRAPTAAEGTEHELAFLECVVPAFLRRLRQKQNDRDHEEKAVRIAGRPPNTPPTSLTMRPLKALNTVRVVMCTPDEYNCEQYKQRFEAQSRALLERALAEKPAAGEAPLGAQFAVAVHFEHPNEMFKALGMPQRLGEDY